MNDYLSFIIVNFNGLNFTKECIVSITDRCHFNYEIIVIDNSPSKDDFIALTKFVESTKGLERIKLLKVENNGFGSANNIGVFNSKGDYIFFLNNDAEILKFCNLDLIIDGFSNENVGIIAPKVLNPDLSIQPSTSTFVNLFASTLRYLRVGKYIYKNRFLSTIIKLLLTRFNKEASSYFDREKNQEKARIVEWASACGLIIKKDVFMNLGMFDENFFMYFEDEELCYRFTKNEKYILYYPNIEIIHHVGASSKKLNKKIEIEKIKSEFYYYSKHYDRKLYLLKALYKYFALILSPFNNRFKMIHNAFKTKQI